MKQPYLEVGRIVSTSGLKGEVRVQSWADSPEFLGRFETLYLGGDKAPVQVEGVRTQKNVAILKLAGVESVEEANGLRGRSLWCARSDVQLGERTYFIQDLIGLRVVDADDAAVEYGTLTDVSPTGANDVYHIEKDGKTILIPAIRQVVIETDVEGGVMRIRPMKGLFDDV